jgi:hypothetical protein
MRERVCVFWHALRVAASGMAADPLQEYRRCKGLSYLPFYGKPVAGVWDRQIRGGLVQFVQRGL